MRNRPVPSPLRVLPKIKAQFAEKLITQAQRKAPNKCQAHAQRQRQHQQQQQQQQL